MSEIAPEELQPQVPDGEETLEDPAAEPSTTEQPQGPPATIPYTRFKEVNDSLRPYRELERQGYSAEELQQLVEWDSMFSTDPAGTILTLATQIEDFPQEVKEAMERHLNGQTSPQGQGQPPQAPQPGPAETEEPPKWAKPILEDYESRQAASEQAVYDQMVDEMLSMWDTRDQDEQVPDDQRFSEARKLTFIAAHASRGESIEEILDSARGEAMELRADILKPTTARSSTPRRVPGGAAPSGAETPVPKTLSEATQLARQHLVDTGQMTEEG